MQVTVTSANGVDDFVVVEQKDIWSAAYSEAVHSMGEKVNSVILKGEKLETVLQKLQETNEDHADESLFRRGLRNLETPLHGLKLALDLTKPFLCFEPTASTAVGVVSCVTAVSFIPKALIISSHETESLNSLQSAFVVPKVH